jgi:pilus assembly protein CpaE
MRSAFECTVVDLPRSMLVQHPHLLHDCNSAVLVTEFTLAAARDAIRILAWLKSNAPQAQIVVIANKVIAGATEVNRKDFETSIERKIDLVIPHDPKLASQAAKLGKPLAEVGKNGKTTAPIGELARRIVSAADSDDVAPAKGGKSLLGKVGDFKSMLPKRKTKA